MICNFKCTSVCGLIRSSWIYNIHKKYLNIQFTSLINSVCVLCGVADLNDDCQVQKFMPIIVTDFTWNIPTIINQWQRGLFWISQPNAMVDTKSASLTTVTDLLLHNWFHCIKWTVFCKISRISSKTTHKNEESFKKASLFLCRHNTKHIPQFEDNLSQVCYKCWYWH